MKRTRRYFAFLLILAASTVGAAEKADFVLVEKSDHRLSVFKQGRLLASYHVVFGSNPVGHKEKQGDGKTPEGRYTLDRKKADSAFYKAFHVSYPRPQDIARAKKLGISPGGDIMVHGQKDGLGWMSSISQQFDWTQGCIAMTNEDMDAMWETVDVGTPIEIRP